MQLIDTWIKAISDKRGAMRKGKKRVGDGFVKCEYPGCRASALKGQDLGVWVGGVDSGHGLRMRPGGVQRLFEGHRW